MMKKLSDPFYRILPGLLLIMLLCFPAHIQAQDESSKSLKPGGIYIELTKDFYEALRGDSQSGVKTYTNDPSVEYLRQIAISSKFMVETNLQILKQQERIIELLEAQRGGK